MTRRSLAALSLALLLPAFGFGAACHEGRAPEERPPSSPRTAPAVLGAVASAPGSPEPSGVAVAPGMPRLAVVLEDPRLAAVREQEQARDWGGAARALRPLRGSAALDARQACEWSYLIGRLHVAAGEPAESIDAFEDVVRAGPDGGAPCVLAPYAALHEVQALVHLGRFDEAVLRATSVSDDFGARDELELALADAQAGRGNRAASVPIWRSRLEASPHGVRWVDSALQLANALLDGVDGPADAHADEALELATRVLVEAPAIAEKVDVVVLRTRAALAGRHGPQALTPEQRASQAQAWLDSGQRKHAGDAAEALLKPVPRGAKEHHEAWCKGAIVRAQAKPRGKAEESADAWSAAIARCEGEDDLVTALYYGAKASSSAHRPAEAIERFGRVEKLFPKHRLADDACLRAATLLGDEGDETRALARLASLPDAYPDGDMAGEALFRLALARFGRHDLAGARDALDRLLGAGLDSSGALGGRAAYFRARASQLAGDADDAARRYTTIVRDQPLGYYMLLAYARLHGMSEAAAAAAVQAGTSREADGPLVSRDHPELASPAFQRLLALLEVGEIDWARREVHHAGWTAEGVDPEVVWTIAWLYDRAGAPEISHAFARSRLVDYREHWPVGRWRLAWEIAYPRVWQTLVSRESEDARVPVPLTWAIMREESAFNPEARSVADAIGLMQLIAPTARVTARGTGLPFDEESLRRPEVSIALGARLLSSLRASFSANPALAIAAYNGGAGAVRRWLVERSADDFDLFVERIPFDETRAYLKRVLASEAAYAFLYAPKDMDELLALPVGGSSEMVAAH